ncbi:MAG: caspase family protein [Bradyrhizobiaceae bacterium]|nr:caspase family protein [Bradyrhizobiaceae bacterium]
MALVIGNDRYVNLAANEQLQKAVNDARAVRGTLRQIGFDVVSEKTSAAGRCSHDLTRRRSGSRRAIWCSSSSRVTASP